MEMSISRFGWIGRKVGMTNVQKDKKVLAVTLIEIFRQNVIEKFMRNNGYVLKIGIELHKVKKKPQLVELEKLNKPKCSLLKEFKVSKEEYDSVGDSYGLERMESEKWLDVSAKNIGKGFAGGMKRWNFQGAGASHGTSLTHRAIGSTGTREKNWKGKKMPGRLGGEMVTVQNLLVTNLDPELNLVAVCGSVPGKVGSIVFLRKAIKKQEVGYEC